MLAAAPLAAQEQGARSGFWWGFGLGYGIYHHTCDECDRPRGDAAITAGYVALGATVSQRLTLGLELAAGTLPLEASVTSVSLVGTCYVSKGRGPFLRGGVGTSSYRQVSYVEFPRYKGTGSGWLAAVGWDVPLGGGPTLTPMITLRAGAPGTVVAAIVDTAATNLRQRSIALTLGVTFP